VTHLDTVNVQADRRHDRRALAVNELLRLLTATETRPECEGMAGADRAMLYRLAVETGLRRGELESLTRGSFDLAPGSDPPTVTVRAAYSKRRRDDVLPLRADTAAKLRAHLSAKLPAAKAFVVPERGKTAKMLRADL
jgi:integrase